MNTMLCETAGILRGGDVFEWKIPGYVLKHRSSTKRSDLFGYKHLSEYKFCLSLHCHSTTCGNLMSFGVQLHRIPVFNCELDSGVPVNSKENMAEKMDVRFILYKSNSAHCWSYCMTFEKDRLTADFPRIENYDSLTVQCIMMSPVEQRNINTSSQRCSYLPEVPHSLENDMAALLSCGNLSDVTLCVDDQELKAHSCILASRSEVFEAMFKHDTQEKREKKIIIIDFPSEIICHILKYIYTNQIGMVTPEQMLLLFSAADKYALVDLRKKCSRELRKNLPLYLVTDVLLVADLHQDDDLKEAAVHIFLKNAVSVMSSEQWLPFMTNHAELANVLLMQLAKKSCGTQNT